MANVLASIFKGTSDTIGDATTGVRRAAVPNPARSIYNLGMGMGPLIQNIVAQLDKHDLAAEKKKKNEDKQKAKPATEKQQQAAYKETKSANKQIIGQLSMMNKLLGSIRRIQLAETLELDKSRKRLNDLSNGKSNAKRGDTESTKLAGPAEKESAAGVDGINTFLKVAAGAATMGAFYKLLPQNIKDAAGDLAGQVNKDIVQPAISGIGDLIVDSFKEAPVATVIAGLAVAKFTRMLDLAVDVAKATYYTGRGAYQLGKLVSSPWEKTAQTGVQAANVASNAAEGGGMMSKIKGFLGIGAKAAEAAGPAMAGGKPLADGIKLFNQLGEVGLKRAGYGAEAIEAIKNASSGAAAVAGETATAAKVAEQAAAATASASKPVAGILGKLGGVAKTVGKALGPLGVIMSGWSAKENFEAGNEKLGWLDTISATTGAAALGAAATGVGLPAAGVLGGISLATGVASSIGSFFVDKDKPKGPPAAGSGTPDAVGNGKLPTGSWQSDKEFLGEVDRLTAKYQIKKEDLLALFAAESGPNMFPFIQNKQTHATGLIQFMPDTATELGTSTEALRRMTRADQMKYVEKYFDKWGLPKGATAGDLYTAVFAPAALKSGRNELYRAGSREYNANRGLDVNRDNVITRDDLTQRLAQFGASTTGTVGIGPAPGVAGSPTQSITPSSVSTVESMTGALIADNQDALNKILTAMTGQEIKLDVSNIMAAAQAQAQSDRAAPSRTERSKSNPALDRANFVAGQST